MGDVDPIVESNAYTPAKSRYNLSGMYEEYLCQYLQGELENRRRRASGGMISYPPSRDINIDLRSTWADLSTSIKRRTTLPETQL